MANKSNSNLVSLLDPNSCPNHSVTTLSHLTTGDIFWHNHSYYQYVDNTEKSKICLRDVYGDLKYFDQPNLTVLKVRQK